MKNMYVGMHLFKTSYKGSWDEVNRDFRVFIKEGAALEFIKAAYSKGIELKDLWSFEATEDSKFGAIEYAKFGAGLPWHEENENFNDLASMIDWVLSRA